MASAEGFAVLYGPDGCSKEINLMQQSASTFHSGTQDTWTTADMQDLGALQKLSIGLKGAVCLSIMSMQSSWLCIDISSMLYSMHMSYPCSYVVS